MRKQIIMDYLNWVIVNSKETTKETVNEFIRATTGHDCEDCGLRIWAKEHLAAYNPIPCTAMEITEVNN